MMRKRVQLLSWDSHLEIGQGNRKQRHTVSNIGREDVHLGFEMKRYCRDLGFEPMMAKELILSKNNRINVLVIINRVIVCHSICSI